MFQNTKTKKVVSALVAVAFVFSLVGGVAHADTVTTTTTSTTTAAPYVFTQDLTIGSTGADVVALQQLLVSQGFLVMPAGVSYGYFGPLTKAALGAFQAAHGISPTAGYFGPITKGYIAVHPELFTGVSTGGTATCPAGFTCTPVAGSVPCPTGYTCTPVGGGTTVGGSLSGNGTLVVTQGPPGGNSNIQTNTDTPVYGLQLRAQLGDVRVDRIDLDVSDVIQSTPTSLENPGNFINNIKVWDGTTKLLDRNVSSADFVTGTSSTDYYIRLANINFLIPSDQTKNLVVSFSTASSIDTNRQLTIRGYGATSLLYYSGASNVANYVDISGVSTVQTFQKPGNSTVILSLDPSNPLSQTNYVDANTGTQQPQTLTVFNTNTTQGSASVTQVVASINASGTVPTGVHLFQGSTELQYRTVSSASSTVTFDNLNLASTSGGNVYSIRVDYPSAITEGSAASSSIYTVTYNNSTGNTQTANGLVRGNTQYFFTATPQLAFVSASTAVNNNSTTTNQPVTASFTFTATPYPGQGTQFYASNFTVIATGGPVGTSTTLSSKSLVYNNIQPTNNVLSAGTQYNMTLSASASALPAGLYTFYVTAATSTVVNAKSVNVNINQTWGFDNWHTQPVSVY